MKNLLIQDSLILVWLCGCYLRADSDQVQKQKRDGREVTLQGRTKGTTVLLSLGCSVSTYEFESIICRPLKRFNIATEVVQ